MMMMMMVTTQACKMTKLMDEVWDQKDCNYHGDPCNDDESDDANL